MERKQVAILFYLKKIILNISKMTVKELISALKNIPTDTIVFVESPDVFNIGVVDLVELETVIAINDKAEGMDENTKAIALISRPQSQEFRWN